MIYVACGSITLVIGILWLISPAKRPNPFYGYFSYLSQVNKASFRFAQKKSQYVFYYIWCSTNHIWSGNTFFKFG